AGDCAVLGGLWGGSGSTCGSGTTFDNSWPCSWPTGACCFGDNPYNGITYCDNGKTFGDCLNPPPGGSGGSAWAVGATCGTLIDIDGVLCIPTRDAEGTDRGTCCIPEYFGVENPDLDPFVVNYSCHVTNKNKCISLGGLWSNEETFCSDINCCELHGDCTLGPNGSCCQFRKLDNEFFRCDNIPLYSCEQIAASNSNIVTLFYEGEECNDENGYPCKDAIFVTDSCCLWQPDGTYIGCQNIGEDDACPPAPEYIGIRFDQPCDSAGFDCSIQEFGACCVGLECITASRSVCLDLGGMFYSGKNCINDCDSIPCCNQKDNEVVACYNKHNLPIEDLGSDRCLDSYHVA
ncbi:MAG: hypothetical protein QF704_16125, partial [Anaerolineales bacterium]|nr:hypothetical protein [Anaerolineales bacterium]